MGKIKGKVYVKFHKVHFRENSALLPRVLYCTIKALFAVQEVLFVGNKTQLPTCSSAG